MQLKRVAEAKLPTPWGDFLMVGFEELATGHDHVALVYGDISGHTPVLARVHSECLTGDALFSLRCDCGFQLEAALTQIAEEGRGILLYHRQEGRNIGLLNKIRARVSIMMGRVFMAKGEYAKAVESLQRVISQDRELVSETLEMLQTCYQQLGKTAEWAEFLQRAVEENTGADAELMLADIIEARDGSEAAQVYITRQLQRHPTMRVFHKLMDYHLNEAEEGRAKESLMVLRDMVGEKVRSKPRYRCQKCGFTAYTLYWHCPSCRAWSTIKPIRGLDGL